ncbi:class I SAM-dependent methyltransferase [Paenibacillus sp. P25]|nr:class I SAM-dependent methyltransferase [Paenibacillus sp. P25]
MNRLREDWVDRWNFDGLSESWDEPEGGRENHLPSEAVHAQVLEAAAARIAPRPGETGLDAGTGDGAFAVRLHRPEVRLAAIDQSRRMLAHCRRRVPGIDARLGNLLSLPFFDGRFDFVVTSFALHHLSEEQRPLALGEMVRVLKPKGRIAVVDWMTDLPGERAR